MFPCTYTRIPEPINLGLRSLLSDYIEYYRDSVAIQVNAFHHTCLGNPAFSLRLKYIILRCPFRSFPIIWDTLRRQVSYEMEIHKLLSQCNVTVVFVAAPEKTVRTRVQAIQLSPYMTYLDNRTRLHDFILHLPFPKMLCSRSVFTVSVVTDTANLGMYTVSCTVGLIHSF